MSSNDIISRINNKHATAGIIGLGYVGLPLALCFAEKGFKAIGFDIDQDKVNSLAKGESYIKHIPAERVRKAVDKDLSPTNDFSKLPECDAILIAVPTPLRRIVLVLFFLSGLASVALVYGMNHYGREVQRLTHATGR